MLQPTLQIRKTRSRDITLTQDSENGWIGWKVLAGKYFSPERHGKVVHGQQGNEIGLIVLKALWLQWKNDKCAMAKEDKIIAEFKLGIAMIWVRTLGVDMVKGGQILDKSEMKQDLIMDEE